MQKEPLMDDEVEQKKCCNSCNNQVSCNTANTSKIDDEIAGLHV